MRTITGTKANWKNQCLYETWCCLFHSNWLTSSPDIWLQNTLLRSDNEFRLILVPHTTFYAPKPDAKTKGITAHIVKLDHSQLQENIPGSQPVLNRYTSMVMLNLQTGKGQLQNTYIHPQITTAGSSCQRKSTKEKGK
jgi:hypothetical protein